MSEAHRPLPAPLTTAARAERARRVAEVARLVAESRYRVPADDVARAVLAFHRERGAS